MIANATIILTIATFNILDYQHVSTKTVKNHGSN